jgi:predicted Fe-Mo cluster-binding NifX family protein
MKVAVSCEGKTLESPVDQRFGRAAWFLVVDTSSMTFDVLENTDASAGAGINAAKLLVDGGAQAVLTGNCGPNAERTLTAGSVKLFTGVTGTVAEALEQFKEDQLTEASGRSVQSHSGMGS